ncbi:DivIVA domain-containing protein [Yinghuangia sp. YIM S10712]|uniref:DivIVA domain-containing protein n=1 Tax=Yinghuangia sp. YIM S10712 TaxID=3436930 RepID=UPI003F5357C5
MTDKFPGFSVVRRGYDRAEVDRFLLGEDGGPFGPARFAVVRRGYDCGEVDAWISELRRVGSSGQAPAVD